MKYTFHFTVKYDGKRREGTYANATREELETYIMNHFPAGDGRCRELLDMGALQILSAREQ